MNLRHEINKIYFLVMICKTNMILLIYCYSHGLQNCSCQYLTNPSV